CYVAILSKSSAAAGLGIGNQRGTNLLFNSLFYFIEQLSNGNNFITTEKHLIHSLLCVCVCVCVCVCMCVCVWGSVNMRMWVILSLYLYTSSAHGHVCEREWQCLCQYICTCACP